MYAAGSGKIAASPVTMTRTASGISHGSKSAIIAVDLIPSTQLGPATPAPPVGGTVLPVNKLVVLVPYLAILGILADMGIWMRALILTVIRENVFRLGKRSDLLCSLLAQPLYG